MPCGAQFHALLFVGNVGKTLVLRSFVFSIAGASVTVFHRVHATQSTEGPVFWVKIRQKCQPKYQNQCIASKLPRPLVFWFSVCHTIGS